MLDINKYVVGFPYCKTNDKIILTRKDRGWMNGRWNGIGGKIEEGELPLAAMGREAEEEIGLTSTWEHFATLEGPGYELYCFLGEFDITFLCPKVNDVGEIVEKFTLSTLNETIVIPNLLFLLPMCIGIGAEPQFWPYQINHG